MTEEISETWKDKVYEIELTKRFYLIGDLLREAQTLPTVENVKEAFSGLKMLLYELLEGKEFIDIFKKEINPEFEKIEILLFGNPQTGKYVAAMCDYGTNYETNPKTGKFTIVNIQNIINSLWSIFRIFKEWAWKSGFFVRKPFERRYGKAGIEDTMQM